jgi:hypothetical protein
VLSVYGLVRDSDDDRQALRDQVTQLSAELADERRARADVQQDLDRVARRVARRLKP